MRQILKTSIKNIGNFALRPAISLILLAILCIGIRLPGIGDSELFVDESGFIGASLSPTIAAQFDALGQGRPLIVEEFSLPAKLCRPHSLKCITQAERIFVSIIGSITAVILFAIVRANFGILAAVMTSIIFALSPMIWAHDRFALHDPLTAFYLMLSILLGTRIKKSSSWSSLCLIFSGVCFSLAVLNKVTAIISIPWVVAFIYIASPSNSLLNNSLARRQAWINWWKWILGAALTWVPLGRNIEHFGANLARFKHTPILPSFSAPLSGVTDFCEQLGFSVFRYLQFLIEYQGIFYLLLVILSVFYIFCSLLRVRIFCSAAALSFLLSIIAYSSRSHARYFYPEMIPQFVLIGIAISHGWSRIRSGQAMTKELLSIRLMNLLLVVTLGWWSVVRISVNTNYADNILTHNIFDTVRADYSQYVGLWTGGTGINELIGDIEHSRSAVSSIPLNILVSPFHLSGKRALELNYIHSSDTSIITIPFFNDGDALDLSFWLQRVYQSDPSFSSVLILDEPISIDLDLNSYKAHLNSLGIEVSLISEITRPNNGWFRLWRPTVIDWERLYAALPAQTLILDKDMGPRVVAILNSSGDKKCIHVQGIIDQSLDLRDTQLSVSIDNDLIAKISPSHHFSFEAPIVTRAGERRVELRVTKWLLRPDASIVRSGYPNLNKAGGVSYSSVALIDNCEDFEKNLRSSHEH